MSSSVTKRFDLAYGVCGDISKACVLQANRIAARTVLLLMVAMVLGIDWVASWCGSNCNVVDFKIPGAGMVRPGSWLEIILVFR